MKRRTEADIDAEMKRLSEQKKALINTKKLAYASGISKAIKAGHLNASDIKAALSKVVTSKKDRALLGLGPVDPDETKTPPPLPTRR